MLAFLLGLVLGAALTYAALARRRNKAYLAALTSTADVLRLIAAHLPKYPQPATSIVLADFQTDHLS